MVLLVLVMLAAVVGCTDVPSGTTSTASGGSGGAGGATTSSSSTTSSAMGGAGGEGGAGGKAPFVCPQDGVRGSGTHRVFVQGHDAKPIEGAIYPFLHEWKEDGSDAELCDDSIFVDDTNMDGVWQPGEEPHPLGPSALVHGEHFLVGPSAYAEFKIVLCDDITGDIALYIPNFDVAGSEALHQVFAVHEGKETLIAETIDDEAGQNGYNPFIRVLSGKDPDVVPGDTLLLRSTNLNGYQFSVMVWQPPSEYESWLLVTVP